MKKPSAHDNSPFSKPPGARPASSVIVDRETVELKRLEKRIGKIHLRQRLGIEAGSRHPSFGHGRTFFHIENWYSIHSLIRLGLRCLGLYRRGIRNATPFRSITTKSRSNPPDALHDFTLLHLSDLHLDMDSGYPTALIERLRQVRYGRLRHDRRLPGQNPWSP
ncbi:MAG: hypothetical protein R3F40_15690 [Candidatus Competibacteraceae bacterium]